MNQRKMRQGGSMVVVVVAAVGKEGGEVWQLPMGCFEKIAVEGVVPSRN